MNTEPIAYAMAIAIVGYIVYQIYIRAKEDYIERFGTDAERNLLYKARAQRRKDEAKIKRKGK